jgi:hypothetical protein
VYLRIVYTDLNGLWLFVTFDTAVRIKIRDRSKESICLLRKTTLRRPPEWVQTWSEAVRPSAFGHQPRGQYL